MSAGTPQVFGAYSSSVAVEPSIEDQRIRELNLLALRGLMLMFDAESRLFCYRVRSTWHGLVREGYSRRYTVMALLGLQAFEKTGVRCPIDVNGAIEACASDPSWIRGVGDLGLLIWLIAEYAPDQLDDLFQRVNLETSLDRYADAREARTMELAWFLTGVCHAATGSSRRWSLDDLAVETYHLLEENRGESGLFGHSGRRKSLAGFVRGRIGSFADQIYTIHALTKFATTFHLEEPLEAAVECAAVICRLQGPLGQWWWSYDAPSGRVLSRYPVFSVEQYGLAPLALLSVEAATGQRFHDAVHRGLRWIYGSNEVGEDLRSSSHELIWRCILPMRNLKRYWDAAFTLLGSSGRPAPGNPFRVEHESRPNDLGMLLYSLVRCGSGR